MGNGRRPEYIFGYREGWRDAITYIMKCATEMSDPAAKKILHSIASQAGNQAKRKYWLEMEGDISRD